MKKQILFLTLCIALLLSGCQKTPEALPAVQAEETPCEAESQDSQPSYNDLRRADGRGRRMGLLPQRI